jgi:hypothetical protein
MKRILRIELSGAMYEELIDAAERTAKRDEEACDPVAFAKELIESALAERRLERLARLSVRTGAPRCSSLGCCAE